jgi:hypothetical protein
MPEEKNIIKPNEFKCAYCGGVYGKKWSDEEAKEEMIDLWGYADMTIPWYRLKM